ncbi:MAG: penicillin-binding protein 1A [Chromatiales bacterium]
MISEYGEKRRIPLTFNDFPVRLRQAFLAAEDDRFYEHPGVDYQGLMRAAVQLALTGKKKQGGSTITMQVARNFFLSKKKTYLRKINEIFLALKIDRELSKEDVLTLYLNKIYLGHRAYGVGAAAQVYYGKTVRELTLPEIAMIAGLPKAPSSYNPITNPQRAVIRRNYVLDRMLELGMINSSEHQLARIAEVTAAPHAANIELDAPYVAEMVRSRLFEQYGADTYTGGFSAYTTIDSRLQNQAVTALRQAINDYDKRHGYRGIGEQLDAAIITDTQAMDEVLKRTSRIGNLKPAIVTNVNEKDINVYLGDGESILIEWPGLEWARSYIDEDHRGPAPKTAAEIVTPAALVQVLQETSTDEQGNNSVSWRLAQIPQVSGALVSIDPNNGAINSLVGGYDFYQTKFNRITQAKRQPGSGFKAFIYSAALENGFTAASLINDAPVVFEDSGLEVAWRPENYSGKFFGPTRLRYALTKSRNLVSIRLLRSMGISNAIEHITKFGFDPDQLPRDLSLALGSANVTPLQMARGYAVLANGGYLIEPYLLTRIEKNTEGVVFEANPKIVCQDCEQVESAETTEAPPVIAENSDVETMAAAMPEEELAKPEYAPRVISAENRFIMYSMMQDVITRGTATRARVLKRNDLAGKTGTTNDQRDAWFNGYNQNIVTTVWVGFDSNQKLGRGEVGGRAALPAWISYMQLALQDYPADQPPSMPAGMVSIRIDPKTGKLAATGQRNAIFEVFRAGNAPTERAETEVPEITGSKSGDSPTITAPVDEGLF